MFICMARASGGHLRNIVAYENAKIIEGHWRLGDGVGDLYDGCGNRPSPGGTRGRRTLGRARMGRASHPRGAPCPLHHDGYAMHEALSAEDRTLRLYLNDLSESKPLSREREVELATRIQQGDLLARDELVQANLRFVVNVAREYQHRGLPLSELISAGNVGLITGAERFDGTKGFKFISYAVWWIRQSIIQTLSEQGRTVRLPLHKVSLLNAISRVKQRLGQGRWADPDEEEIAAQLEVSVDEVRDALISGHTTLSLDEVFGEEDERNLGNTLADTRQASPDEEVLRESTRTQLECILKGLEEREALVLRLYFGLDGGEGLSLGEIGTSLGVTREWVRQLKERAFAKLRHPTRYPAVLALAGRSAPVR